MSVFWRSLRSLLHQDQSTVDWHFILTDESSTTLLRQEDKNVDELQNILQKFSAFDRETFAFVIIFLTTEICLAENDKSLFFHICIVLEIFVFYSITIFDFIWMSNSRAAYIERQIELMLEITSSLVRASFHSNSHSRKNCLWRATQLELISRREHCRVEIIKNIVELIDIMSLDISFMIYDHDNHLHRLNATIFLKWLRLTVYYWIVMAYFLAVEHMIYDSSSEYIDE